MKTTIGTRKTNTRWVNKILSGVESDMTKSNAVKFIYQSIINYIETHNLKDLSLKKSSYTMCLYNKNEPVAVIAITANKRWTTITAVTECAAKGVTSYLVYTGYNYDENQLKSYMHQRYSRTPDLFKAIDNVSIVCINNLHDGMSMKSRRAYDIKDGGYLKNFPFL